MSSYFPRGARAAVSLTYDDALTGHHREVAPELERAGLRGTFNVVPHAGFAEAVDAWRAVAAAGHELGNHTLFHPCRKEPRERFDWLPDDYDLARYSVRRWRDEARVANLLLRLVDGRAERTFANTCCNTTIGTGGEAVELAPIIEEMFVAGRGPKNGRIVRPDAASFGALGHLDGDARSFDELRAVVEEAVDVGGWAVFMFHGVGDAEHRLHVDPKVHAEFVRFLAAEKARVWTAPMVDVAARLRWAGR